MQLLLDDIGVDDVIMLNLFQEVVSAVQKYTSDVWLVWGLPHLSLPGFPYCTASMSRHCKLIDISKLQVD